MCLCIAGWNTKADVSVERVLGAFLAGPAEGQDAEALADLTLAALQQSEDPQQSLSTVISALLLPKPAERLSNGHGHSAQIPPDQASISSEQSSTSRLQTEPHSQAFQDADIIAESGVVERSAVCLPEGEEPSNLPGSAQRSITSPSGGGGGSKNLSLLHMGLAPSAEATGSATPASPHSVTSYTVHSPEAGRLAYLCTLLSRMSAQAEQMQADTQLWQAEALRVVSKHLVKPDVLLSDSHAPKVTTVLYWCLIIP